MNSVIDAQPGQDRNQETGNNVDVADDQARTRAQLFVFIAFTKQG